MRGVCWAISPNPTEERNKLLCAGLCY
jgi:hypothetical protein